MDGWMPRADGVWAQIRKQMHGVESGAGGFAASGAAGGALDEAEARKLAKETVRIASKALRRFSGFTCYAALTDIKASNIEEVSYQILLGSDKYFVSTDGGGNRQQWFALIREDVGGVVAAVTVSEALAEAPVGGGSLGGARWRRGRHYGRATAPSARPARAAPPPTARSRRGAPTCRAASAARRR